MAPSVFTWYRGYSGGAVTYPNRVERSSPIIDAPFTLERVVWSLQVVSQFTEGAAPIPPNSWWLYPGLIIQNTAFGAPNADPMNNPAGDWLWAGQWQMRRSSRSGYTGVGFDLGWWNDQEQMSVTTRRTIGGTAQYRVYLEANTPPQNATNSISWSTRAYLQVLVSRPA